MSEKELLEKIKSSAEEVKVPESLSPEAIQKKIDQAIIDGRVLVDEKEKEKKRNSWSGSRKVIAAAVVCLLCGTGVFASYNMLERGGADGAAKMAEAEGTNVAESAESADSAGEETGAGMDSVSAKLEKKVNAGDAYVVAENYGDIYDALKSQQRGWADTWLSGAAADGVAADGVAVEESGELKKEISMDMSDGTQASGAMKESVTDSVQEYREEKEYSKTNLQTAGVDESDIIKTDGNYIYVVNENMVKIIDIRTAEMKVIGEIKVAMGSAADRVVEMYVEKDVLNLIVQREKTALDTESRDEDEIEGVAEAAEEIAVCDVYYITTNIETELLTYDITDREKPKLTGTIAQDGSYHTSRKVGDVVYLFTQKYMELPNLTKEQAVSEEELKGWIPIVNDIPVAADCIYLPEAGQNGLIVSSVNVKNPDKIVDNTLILNDYVNIYVSSKAIYLYETDYSGNGVSTQIAKFGFKDGIINAVAATSAAGEIYDTFAINEYNGDLRVLTTDWSGSEEENQLYLFDEKLNLTGSLLGIAKGEQIYAARYFGDTVYFVTYRNTDPLFAVDLSDEKNPKILSELKITGFSEYLHFWCEDKLVGIGYETDPNTGNREGIKLSMFDISDPANLTTVGTCVIENMDYSPALYQYKSVLVDADANLIGFAGESYEGENRRNYLLFAWEDGEFESLMTENVGERDALDAYRGIYVEDIFYLVNTDEIISYDRVKDYNKIQTLEF